MDRRDFIRKSMRLAALGGLVGTSGYLLMRDDPKGVQSCDFDFICQNCQKIQSCKLPEAEASRKKDQKF